MSEVYGDGVLCCVEFVVGTVDMKIDHRILLMLLYIEHQSKLIMIVENISKIFKYKIKKRKRNR